MTYAADIAKDVRQAVRNLKDAGRLHTLPKGARVTVSSESGSMYTAIKVTIANVAPEWAWTYGVDTRQLTPEAQKVVNRLTHVAAQAAGGRGWGDVQIAHEDHRITVGQGWTPSGWQPGQD